METATALASIGGRVVIAARDATKATELAAILTAKHPSAKISCLALDLASLDSVSAFVSEFRKRSSKEAWPPLKCLVLNAGLIAFTKQTSKDGHEMTFAVRLFNTRSHPRSPLLPRRACARTPATQVIAHTNVFATHRSRTSHTSSSPLNYCLNSAPPPHRALFLCPANRITAHMQRRRYKTQNLCEATSCRPILMRRRGAWVQA